MPSQRKSCLIVLILVIAWTLLFSPPTSWAQTGFNSPIDPGDCPKCGATMIEDYGSVTLDDTYGPIIAPPTFVSPIAPPMSPIPTRYRHKYLAE